MSFIEFKNVCKMYPGSDKNTVDNFNLNIEEKEFIAFVGPSGCGKSTTLRMIAGFEEITGGELYIDGKKMNEVAPRDRGISMVFQNYALYPHMTVEKNIGYGLKKHEDAIGPDQTESGLGDQGPGAGRIPIPQTEEPFRGTAPESCSRTCHRKKFKGVPYG